MPSIFSLEIELTLMFINKQHEINNLTIIKSTEFVEKQKQDLEQFKSKLEEYKNLLESNKKETSEQDKWLEINYKK